FRDLAGSEGLDFGYVLTRYLYDSGERDAAAAAYASIMQQVRLPPRRDMLATATLHNLAYLTVRFGAARYARAIYDELLPYASAYTSTTVPRPVGAHFLGMLASTLG